MPESADIDDLAMLAEFARLALDRARAAARRAEAIEAEGGDPSIHLIAFDRMGRAMRLALSLRRRFMGEAETSAARRVQAGKDRLRAALVPAIRLHADPMEQVRLQFELDQRLETEADAFADLPLAAGLASLRRVLGLPPFVHMDLADAGGFNPVSRQAPTAPPQGEHLGASDPPPGRSPIEGEVDRPAGPSRRGLQPTAFAATAPFPGPATGPP